MSLFALHQMPAIPAASPAAHAPVPESGWRGSR